MKIAIASDHRGVSVKSEIKAIIDELGHEWIDLGTSDQTPVDYPDISYDATMGVAGKQVDRAILACATGMGMCIAANKVKGIRAAICYDELTARISRTHTDANVLCIAADFIGSIALRKVVTTWLSTEFSGGRHLRRINKIAAIDQGKDPRKQ
jgi:ribose 5-phosphate isomerase B